MISLTTRGFLGCVCLAWSSLASGTAAADSGHDPWWTGYGGPFGSRVYADAAPPTTFSEKDVAWAVKLPSWGHGSPIVVAGKVFVMVELIAGERDLPALVCLDAQTGAILWERTLDHTAQIPDGKAALAAWHEEMLDQAQRFKFARALRADPTNQELLAACDLAGYEFRMNNRDLLWPKDKSISEARMKIAAKAGFYREIYYFHHNTVGSKGCVGMAFATPVSDGKTVYVSTGFGGYFAFDLDGNNLWTAASPGFYDGQDNGARSPILWRDLLISDICNHLRVFDRHSGKLRWNDESLAGPIKRNAATANRLPASQSIATPAVLTIGGTSVLWTAGPHAYRLPEGKPLKIEGWNIDGMQILVKHDEPDVAFFCGCGEHVSWPEKGRAKAGPNPPAAVRFALKNDVLTGTVLWHGGTIAASESFKELTKGRSVHGGVQQFAYGSNFPGLLYDQGRFYHMGGTILNPIDGSWLAGDWGGAERDFPKRAVPLTMHFLAVAGGHVYGLQNGSRKDAAGKDQFGFTMQVFTREGSRVATNFIPGMAGETLNTRQFSYGGAFTFADSAIYVRGIEQLVCVRR